MGLDVYVGPLSRYTLGDWLTIVQQALLAQGRSVQIVRTESDPDDVISDPAVIEDAVNEWQTRLLNALGRVQGWTDTADGAYWTDKPDWDGYGGLILLAAYDEQPERRPRSRRGLMRREVQPDSPRDFQESAAYKGASARPSKYVSLLSAVEWWLPLDDGPTVFEGPRVTGQPTRMSTVKQLVSELEALATAVGIRSEAELEQIRQAGPPDSAASDVERAGRFGLAVFLGLARDALAAQQPLLLDY